MKNTNVISPSDTKEHIIDGYHFKVMSEFASMQEQKNQKEEQAKQANSTSDEAQNEAQENEQESTPNSSAQRIVEILKEKERQEKNALLASMTVGSVWKGTVESLQSYGAFIRLENGLSGLVHISQISTQRIKSAEQVLHVGDEVDVKVIGIKDGKISLSIKALMEEAEKASEEPEEKIEIPKAEAIGTNLGDLFKNIQL